MPDYESAINTIPTMTECQCQGERSTCLACSIRWTVRRAEKGLKDVTQAVAEIDAEMEGVTRSGEAVPEWLVNVRGILKEMV